ncbi:HAD family hydrolase [Pseudonocardia eucalypti]|uniref:HAD family hydrolase n=1 Tax=Pseudonocardia eucalypti TaxID=648755 RepID=A0ABP9Q257_9PSEU|nr:HAD superfamily hydrolase (TIGR01509 family) [Pseudonocardia eucalypti]
MDGTLVDSEKLWDISLNALARHLGGELSAEARVAMVGGSRWRTMEMLFDDLGLPRDAATMTDAGEWLTEYTGKLFTGGLPWRPGALDALRMVRSTGVATALVTSTERRLTERALDSIGREHFDITLCGDEVTATKPDPDPYLRAAQRLGVEPGDCLAVEDSPTGATSAEAAGCAVLVVPCEVPVPSGPRRVQRDTLTGLTESDMRGYWAQIRHPDHWSSQKAHSSPTVADQ